MSDKIAELRKDVAELESLISRAQRQKVKDILSIEVRKLLTQVTKLEEELRSAEATNKPLPKPASTQTRCYDVKLTNYAWDQTPKFVKFYVPLPKCQTLPPDNIYCSFTNKSWTLHVNNLENKNYTLTINKLLEEIIPEESTWQVKSDMILVSAAKLQKIINWSHVTELDRKASDSKKMVPEPDRGADPSDGLMSIMKNMYDQGDDEMKRTIAKAWTESQNKGPAF